jgi:2-polyprenyl-3-methyl-5-hydroxy-6-metoxy-1,4-benzoquinol methylase
MKMYDYDHYWDSLHNENPGDFSAVGYAALGEGFNREAYLRLRLPALRRILHRNRVVPRSLLEAGVGTGAYGRVWHELDVKRWVGLDISPHAITDLRHRFPNGEFHVVDIARPEIALEEKAFDLVTAIDVLYHIVDDGHFETAVRWLSSRVSDRGCLLVSDVFTEAPHGRRFAHVRRRPMEAYLAILEPLGLRLVDREAVFAILGDPVPDRNGRGNLLYLVWRVLQKSIRAMPRRMRNTYGKTVVWSLAPIDRLIRATTDVRGLNLELAIFAPKDSVFSR